MTAVDEFDLEEQEPAEGTGRRRALAARAGSVATVSAEEAAQIIRNASAEATDLVWIDILRPTDVDGAFLRDVLKFHPLAVEDCLYGKQNPKLERYPGYYFLVLYAGRVNPARNRPAFYELHCFVGPHFMVTVRHDSVREVRELMAQWRAAPRHFHSVGHLAHGLADTLVDSYFPLIDHFGTRVAASETEVFEEPDEAMQHIMSLRRELLRFRGVVGPTRDVVASLLRRDLPFLNPDLMPYFQDVRDHAVRVTEEIDTLRDLLSTAVEAQFAVVSNKLNQTVRMMTAWSIILMSMALVTGIYGMNFTRMPELSWRWGYPLSLFIMFSVGALLVLFFRRRKWL